MPGATGAIRSPRPVALKMVSVGRSELGFREPARVVPVVEPAVGLGSTRGSEDLLVAQAVPAAALPQPLGAGGGGTGSLLKGFLQRLLAGGEPESGLELPSDEL